MLGKMMIHGLVAAILIGGAAAVYAQAGAGGTAAPAGNGYLQPGTGDVRSDAARTDKESRKHADKLERHDGQRDGQRDGQHDERRTGRDQRHGHDD